MTVPKAPVDKSNSTVLPKDHVGLSGQLRLVKRVAEAGSVDDGAYADLRLGILSPD